MRKQAPASVIEVYLYMACKQNTLEPKSESRDAQTVTGRKQREREKIERSQSCLLCDC